MWECPVDSPCRAGGGTQGHAAELFRRHVPLKHRCWSRASPCSVTTTNASESLSQPRRRVASSFSPEPGAGHEQVGCTPCGPQTREGHLGSRMLEEAMQLATGAPMATGGPRYRDGCRQPHRTTGSQGWGRRRQVHKGHTPPRVQALMVSPGNVSPRDLRLPPGVPAGPGPPTPQEEDALACSQTHCPRADRPGRRRLRTRTVPAGPGRWAREGQAAPRSLSLHPSSSGQGPWLHLCPGRQQGVSTQWTDGWTEGRGPVPPGLSWPPSPGASPPSAPLQDAPLRGWHRPLVPTPDTWASPGRGDSLGERAAGPGRGQETRRERPLDTQDPEPRGFRTCTLGAQTSWYSSCPQTPLSCPLWESGRDLQAMGQPRPAPGTCGRWKGRAQS